MAEDQPPIDPDLTTLLAAWPTVNAPTRRAILAMIDDKRPPYPAWWYFDWPESYMDMFDGHPPKGCCERCGRKLTDDEKRRFAERYIPFILDYAKGRFRGTLYAIDQDGANVRPWDAVAHDGLLALCATCLVNRIEDNLRSKRYGLLARWNLW
jgi:hypothetical protein